MTGPPSALREMAALALRAGQAIMAHYAEPSAAKYKSDLTPVTEADEAAERIILAGLRSWDAETPVISEEAACAGRIPSVGRAFYLVDPLDGTREFLSRNGEFTVNIARVEDGRATRGVVYAPATRHLFAGDLSEGAWRAEAEPGTSLALLSWTEIRGRRNANGIPVIVASRSHLDDRTRAWLEAQGAHSLVSAGSSLKFCLLASGEADLYPRFGRTMEWDTAAGQAVLEAAGGRVETEAGCRLHYGKADQGFANPPFIARAGSALPKD
jgi:3'(2'), 5'-bisphosphate nucleotidase